MTKISDAAKAYGSYFFAFSKISSLLEQSAHLLHDGTDHKLVEAALQDTLARLSYTGHALHLKYAFTHASLTGEALNIARNGFPHKSEIDGMLIDYTSREANQKPLVAVEAQKAAWINVALKTFEDNADILWRIGERRYLDLLDPERMLIPVVTGDVEYRGETSDGERAYVFWWSCYSSRDHCPCVHILEFTQDIREDVMPMHEEGPAWAAFLQAIRSRGHRTSSVSVMASDIDNALPYIHPKRLTRYTFEHLYTSLLVGEIKEPTVEDLAAQEYFSKFAEEEDFILMFWSDTVVSKGTKESGTFFPGKKEIFDLDQVDDAAINRGATWCSRMVLIPHRFAQIVHSRQGGKIQDLLQEVDQQFTYSGGTIDAV